MGLFSRKKADNPRWICKSCGQEFSIKDIGSVVREGQYTIPSSGNCEGVASEKDEVVCNKCTMGTMVAMGLNNAKKKGEYLTVAALISHEEMLRSDNLAEAYRKIEKRKDLPENSALYDSIRFNNEGKTFVEFTCPKCSKKTIASLNNITIKTPEEQLVFYSKMHEKIPMTCSCGHKYTIYK